MRTTLKRGIGQVNGVNGNGHSAAPPLFGPMVRYQPPEPPRRSIVGLIFRGFAWLVLAALVIGAGAAGGAYLYLHGTLKDVSAHTKDLTIIQQHHQLQQVPPPNKPAIALVAGYDVRGAPGGKNPYAGSNSDTLILMRADPTNNTLSLLSFPRDLWVNVYCHGDTVQTQNRINSAWSYCANGPAGTLDTVQKLTGLHVNYLITLDFHAFTQIVDHLHGVYMNVDRRYFIAPHTGISAINLQPGYQKLDGAQALSYVRYRHTDSDVYRNGRQQLFLDALKSRLKTGLSIFDAPKLIGDLKNNVEVAQGGGGNVTPGQLESYLGLLYGLPAGHLFRNAIPVNELQNVVIGGADVLQTNPANITTAVHSFLHPDVRDVQAVSNQFGVKPKSPKEKKTKVHKLPKSQISVLVLNAGRVAGEAENTSYELTTHGYTTKTLPAGDQANAPKVVSATTVYYDPVQANAQQAAQQLRPLFGPHAVVKAMTPAIASFSAQAGNPLTVVTVGTSFPGTLTIPKPPKVQPKTPPQVSNGAAMVAPRLRQVYDQVHFPLMVPHKIARYSELSSQSGVRGFKPLKNQHEVALTFQVGQTYEYWQIEESTWQSAPILQNPSFSFVKRGQRYNVYTSGGAVQRIALVGPHATYWVSNTILNELSNSTMLAIAESLRPLRR
jgi:LCP family protein required for cell wall assembly